MKKIFPQYVYNPITLIGAAIAALSVGLIVFLFVLDFFSAEENTYMGILDLYNYPIFFNPRIVVNCLWNFARKKKRDDKEKLESSVYLLLI